MAVTYQYTLNAISNIKKNWNTYSAGFSTEEITSATETSPVGGPIYRALIFKYNNNFGCVLLMTYSYQQDRLVFIQCQNNEWGTPYQLR